MTLTTIALNGVPIEQLGVRGIGLDSWLSPPLPKFASSQSVGRVGQDPSARGITWEPRKLTLAVQTPGTGLEASRNTLAAFHRFCQGLLEVEIVDAPGRVCYGVLEGATESVFGVRLLSSELQFAGTLTCYDPLWYDRSPLTVAATTGVRVSVPIGTATGKLAYWLLGPATDPVITVRRLTGEPVGEMRFTVELDDDEALEIDYRNPMPVTRWTAGIASDGFDTLNNEDTFLTIDPDDLPTAETSDGELWIPTWRGHLT